MSQPEIEFDGVAKTFLTPKGAAFTAVEEVGLRIDAGRFVAVVGPSGCGKSTVLNMIAGLMQPTRGAVRYRGEPVDGVNGDTGYMTQRDTLLPWRTVAANVAVPLEIAGVPRRQRRDRIEEMLDLVGLGGFGDRYPAQLSGGMRKRAILARSLIYGPSTLLMDEPFAALDAQLRVQMQQELLGIWERDRKTVVFVTHDVDEALLLGDEVVVFSGSPGRIIHRQEVDIPRPRVAADLRTDPAFNALWHDISARLEPTDTTSRRRPTTAATSRPAEAIL